MNVYEMASLSSPQTVRTIIKDRVNDTKKLYRVFVEDVKHQLESATQECNNNLTNVGFLTKVSPKIIIFEQLGLDRRSRERSEGT